MHNLQSTCCAMDKLLTETASSMRGALGALFESDALLGPVRKVRDEVVELTGHQLRCSILVNDLYQQLLELPTRQPITTPSSQLTTQQVRRAVRKGELMWSGGRRTASDFTTNQRGRIVSKKRSRRAADQSTAVGRWGAAVGQARRELELQGFVPVGGKSSRGKALLRRARAILQEDRLGVTSYARSKTVAGQKNIMTQGTAAASGSKPASADTAPSADAAAKDMTEDACASTASSDRPAASVITADMMVMAPAAEPDSEGSYDDVEQSDSTDNEAMELI